MPCIPLPKITIPTIPGGLSLTVPLPQLHVKIPGICCLLPDGIPINIAPVLPPLTINPAFLVPVRKALAAVEAWIASLPLDCPRTGAT